jgi:hypothetical protein
MSLEARRRDRLVGLSILGLVLLNPPILGLIGDAKLFGWPLPFIYLFLVWAALIGGVACIVERRRRDRARGGG